MAHPGSAAAITSETTNARIAFCRVNDWYAVWLALLQIFEKCMVDSNRKTDSSLIKTVPRRYLLPTMQYFPRPFENKCSVMNGKLTAALYGRCTRPQHLTAKTFQRARSSSHSSLSDDRIVRIRQSFANNVFALCASIACRRLGSDREKLAC